METIRLTVTVDFDGPLDPTEVDDIVEELQRCIVSHIEHGKLNTKHAEPSDYEFEHEAE